MSEPDYDDPYVQRGWGGKTDEARRWDDLWVELLQIRKVWRVSPGRAAFVRFMAELSSLLEQDKRFWKLSAKHAVADLLALIEEDGLLLLREDKEFDSRVRDPLLKFTYHPTMDWHAFSWLILHSLLVPLAALDGVKAEDLSRFDELKNQADQVTGIVTYAHFIDRLNDLIWEDELIERVTAKNFVDAMVEIVEGRVPGVSLPGPEPRWPPIGCTIRSAIHSGNASVSPPFEFD